MGREIYRRVSTQFAFGFKVVGDLGTKDGIWEVISKSILDIYFLSDFKNQTGESRWKWNVYIEILS